MERATGCTATCMPEGALLATYGDTNVYFALKDWLGTKRAEYAANGLQSTFSSLPYGNRLTADGALPDATEHHFTGKERDSESGNDYFGARYYASSMGRWMSPDPAGLAAVNPSYPQTWNLYAYAANNPLIYTDPNGLACVYFNDSGTGLDDKPGADGTVNPIDNNSTTGECKSTGGAWVDGNTDSSLVSANKDGTFNIASTGNGNVYFTQVMAPSNSGAISNFFGFSCSGGTSCQIGSGSASISDLQQQLSPTGGNVYGMLQWAVGQTWKVPFVQDQLIGGTGWCGAGGTGVPTGSGWDCMAHDYNYYLSGNTWPGGNNDPTHSYPGGPLLKKINQQLCNHTSNYLVGQFFAQGWTSVQERTSAMDQIGDANEAFHKKEQLSEPANAVFDPVVFSRGCVQLFHTRCGAVEYVLPPGLK